MARTWFGEIPSCCSLTLLLGSAWVLLKYVLQTIFSGPVHQSKPIDVLGTPLWLAPGLVKLLPAVAYHFCLASPAAFTQPGACL